MKQCKHFKECGGCRFQDIEYNKQLESKQKRVKELLDDSDLTAKLLPINGSEPWYYRNKMEFSFADQEGMVCGLYSKVIKRQVVDIEECLIFSKDLTPILKTIKDFVKEKKYSVHNKYSHQGFLRNLIVRETKFTKEIMIGLVTTGSQELDIQEFLKRLLALRLKSNIKSIYWIINDSLSDAVIFEKKELLWGEATITEKLGGLSFKIGIDTFFQVNPRMIVDFYEKIRKYVRADKEKNVLDLFCGVGSIGIFLAEKAKFVWGVEQVEQIVEMAWRNAKENNIDNISFFTSDTRRFLNTQGSFYKDVDILIVNPPRSGLSNKIIRAILRLNPKTVLYSSCNPEALFRDLKSLSEGFNLDFIESFDFFPHTKHLEVCSLLHKK